MRGLNAIREVDAAVRAIQRCPAPCEDGMVLVRPASVAPRKVVCPVVREDCHFGAQMDARLEGYIVGLMASAGIPSRHLDHFRGHKDTPSVIGARVWEMRGTLLLMGMPGVGKSFGAVFAVYTYLRSRIPRSKWLDTSAWAVASEAAGDVCWTSAKEIADDRQTAGQARRAGFLVMDDLGKEEALKKPTSDICDVISRRYDAKLSMVITTELTLKDIEARYGRYIFERIAEDARSGGRAIDGGKVSMRAAAAEDAHGRE